jgi:hypothetical protein
VFAFETRRIAMRVGMMILVALMLVGCGDDESENQLPPECLEREDAYHRIWKDCMDNSTLSEREVSKCQEYARALVCHKGSRIEGGWLSPTEQAHAFGVAWYRGTRCSEWASDAQAYHEVMNQLSDRLGVCARDACQLQPGPELPAGSLDECEQSYLDGDAADNLAEEADGPPHQMTESERREELRLLVGPDGEENP